MQDLEGAVLRRVAASALVVCLILAWIGCGPGPSNDQRVVARVGNAVLRIADVQAAFPDNPRLGISEAQVRSYVQRWINTELLAQEAKRRGLDRSPKVRRQLADLRQEVLATAVVESETVEGLTLTNEELRARYEKDAEAFRRPEDEYLLQEILVPTWQQATELRTRILNGESFEALAEQNSQASSARSGGSTGYLRRAQMAPEVAQQVPRAPLGRVLSPVKTEAGYYLVKVVDVKPAGSLREFAEVEDLLRERVLVEKMRERQRELVERLRARQSVYVDFGALAEVLAHSTRGPQ